jgi:histidinol-phosphate phosphatase family protein
MQAVILAGGKGTRLREQTGPNIPKPMIPILGIPLLERTVCTLRGQGFRRLIFLLGHQAEFIINYFGSGSSLGVHIRYCCETRPRGTAGALIDCQHLLEDDFIVLYGDTLIDMEFKRIVDYHSLRNADLSLFAHPNDHPEDSDLLEIDSKERVTKIHQYPHCDNANHRNLANAACYVMKRELLAGSWPSGAIDIAKDALPIWIDMKKRIFAYRGDGYIKDIGTPRRLGKAMQDLTSGVVDRKSGLKPRIAVFLDRDGTLNVQKGFLKSPEELEIYDNIGTAIRALNNAGILAIVVTNQSIVARGIVEQVGLDAIHRRLEYLLAEEGAFLDEILYCPHHPDSGFIGEAAELKFFCTCRKPSTGLIDKACSRFNIDRNRSWLIGDSGRDLMCANNAGLKPVLVKTGFAGQDIATNITPSLVSANASSAIYHILACYGIDE